MTRCLPVFLLMTSCVGATTLNGARTLDVRQTTVTVGGANNVVSAQVRHGLAPDLDIGFSLRNASLGSDLRLRFYRDERLHLAVAPGVQFVLNGLQLDADGVGAVGSGFIDVALPVVAELELTRNLSVVLSPKIILSNRLFLSDRDGSFFTEDVTWTTVQSQLGTRVDLHNRFVAVGASFDVRSSVTQAERFYVIGGVDVTVPWDRVQRRAKRAVRRQERGKTP